MSCFVLYSSYYCRSFRFFFLLFLLGIVSVMVARPFEMRVPVGTQGRRLLHHENFSSIIARFLVLVLVLFWYLGNLFRTLPIFFFSFFFISPSIPFLLFATPTFGTHHFVSECGGSVGPSDTFLSFLFESSLMPTFNTRRLSLHGIGNSEVSSSLGSVITFFFLSKFLSTCPYFYFFSNEIWLFLNVTDTFSLPQQ